MIEKYFSDLNIYIYIYIFLTKVDENALIE